MILLPSGRFTSSVKWVPWAKVLASQTQNIYNVSGIVLFEALQYIHTRKHLQLLDFYWRFWKAWAFAVRNSHTEILEKIKVFLFPLDYMTLPLGGRVVEEEGKSRFPISEIKSYRYQKLYQKKSP